jgi:hypothetical protein
MLDIFIMMPIPNEVVLNLWIVGSSPTMTMKRKQLQVLLEAVFPGLSFPT